MRRIGFVTAVLCLPALVAAPSAMAKLKPSYVHAHRGGTLATEKGKQVPVFGEETMPAFEAAAENGFVLEVDAKLSSDGVPLAIHDATLDRTTPCDGQVSARTASEIRSQCPVDLLGTADVTKQLGPNSKKISPVPPLSQVLKLAKKQKARVNLEIKNVPTDPDFDVTYGYAVTVAEAVRASGFPPKRLIVQSFLSGNLDVIKNDPYFADAELSLLSLGALNSSGPSTAAMNGYDWASPEWPVDASYVAEAHGLGLRIAPYTLNTKAEVTDAANLGVDAVITDDPGMALRAARAGSG